MKKNPLIYLVGARASGKTTLAKELSAHLQCSFVDTDTFIQEKAGCSIADMVAEHGWEYFRNAESAALQTLTQKHQEKQATCIIATGGGMVLRSTNRDFMQEHGFVCYLSVPAKELYARLCTDPKHEQRPALGNVGLLEEVQQTLEVRLPLYKEVAHLIVDATCPPAQLVQEIQTKASTFFNKTL